MTYEYIFLGKIYPERVNFTLTGLPEINFSHPDNKIEGILRIEIVKCNIQVILRTNSIITPKTTPNIETIKNIIEKLVRAFVDAYCFVHSYNYDLTIDSVKNPELKLDYLFPVIGEFGFKGNNQEFLRVTKILLEKFSPSLTDAFGDYRRSIKYPDATAAHCLRALESLRREHFDDESIPEGNNRDKDGWKKMSGELKVKPNGTYKKMQKYATPNRHGEYPFIPYSDRKEIMSYTRRVIDAFINWLENSPTSTKLPK